MQAIVGLGLSLSTTLLLVTFKGKHVRMDDFVSWFLMATGFSLFFACCRPQGSGANSLASSAGTHIFANTLIVLGVTESIGSKIRWGWLRNLKPASFYSGESHSPSHEEGTATPDFSQFASPLSRSYNNCVKGLLPLFHISIKNPPQRKSETTGKGGPLFHRIRKKK